MNIKESFDITLDTSAMDIMGRSGYSLATAISDIIDNSIYAQASNIYLDFEFEGADSVIKIIDDGKGMTLEKLKNACVIGFDYFNDNRETFDLGRFSTGLKSASRSMANQLIIQSVHDECNTVMLDFQKMNKVGWKGDLIDSDEIYVKSKTGTAVIWKNLKNNILTKSKESFYDKIAAVETHLNHTFNDYIKAGVNIWINHSYKLEGWDPFCLNMGTMLIDDVRIPYADDEILIKTYILPQYSNLNPNDQNYMRGYGLGEQQGFYIYRNKRLILEGGWLGLDGLAISNKFDYARIRVDISSKLDSAFSTNYMKDTIYLPEDLKPKFKKAASKARTGSLKNYNYMKGKKIVKSVKSDRIIYMYMSFCGWNESNL